MIVVCPSCRQRYRHEIPVETPAPRAHCSGCDERFDLTPQKRSYVLAATLTLAPTSTIEIDLPSADGATQYAPENAGKPFTIEAATEALEATLVRPAAPEAEEARPATASRYGAIGEALVALVPCGVGAAMAYHFAGLMDKDPITWAALGGAVGLLMGWACLLWITRED